MLVNKNQIIYFIFGEKLCSIYDVDISVFDNYQSLLQSQRSNQFCDGMVS